jgi:serine/threonine protein kinase
MELVDIKCLGEGGYGRIYSGLDEKGERQVVKQILCSKRISFCSSIKEIDILSEIRNHKFIIPLKDLLNYDPFSEGMQIPNLSEEDKKLYKKDGFYIILQEGTRDLSKQIYEYQTSDSLKKLMMLQMLVGVEYLHGRWILHRDLKPGNILWCEKSQSIKICDMGMCLRFFGQKVSGMCQSIRYRAPEVLLKFDTYNEKIDVWSLGCIFFELIAKKPLFRVKSEEELLEEMAKLFPYNEFIKLCGDEEKVPNIVKKYKKYNRKTFREVMDLKYEEIENFRNENEFKLQNNGSFNQFLDLLSKMLDINPAKRITIAGAISHEFFSGYYSLVSTVRRTIPPTPPQPNNVQIIQTEERKKFVKKIQKSLKMNKQIEYRWLNNYFIIFHSIEIFDRYNNYILNQEYIEETPREIPSFRSIPSERCLTNFTPSVGSKYEKLSYTDDPKRNFNLICCVIIYMVLKYFSEEHVGEIYTFQNVIDLIFDSQEKISVEEYERCKNFEYKLIKNILQFKIFNLSPYEAYLEKNGNKHLLYLLITYMYLSSGTYSPRTIYNKYVKLLNYIKDEKLKKPSFDVIEEYFKNN